MIAHLPFNEHLSVKKEKVKQEIIILMKNWEFALVPSTGAMWKEIAGFIVEKYTITRPGVDMVKPLNLSILDADILIIAARSKIDDVLIEHGGLPYVLPLTFHLKVWRGSFQTFLTLVYGSRGFWD